MGTQLIWQDRYNIGVDSIDKEHKKLFSIASRLLAARGDSTKDKWVCQEGIKYFQDHALKHFAEEEVYMASIGYAGFEKHRQLHDNFRKNTLPGLKRELERTNYSEEAVNHFLGVCVGWLIGHTLTEDFAITGKSMSKWAKLLPDDQQEEMKKLIIQLHYDLFELEATVLSDNYGGEKFGKGIYYRMVYNSKEGEKWEIILALEEKLIVSTIGEMIGTKSEELNIMMVNAARYTAQQFVNRIRGHFQFADMYEMKEENLLSYTQFQKIFERQHPQISLLLDTGAGYFAFCMFAPHLLQSGGETSLNADNAMVEIRKYLKNNKASKKKKILVVDDSAVVLKAMKELLGEDYEITTAKSGLSAIRCITLNRPNLVLLDYEMPVCDGKQVLEMIRAEDDFRDIAVVFLTGRSDAESIKNVMALRPAGYMIKNQKPEEIKKFIDNFLK